MLSVSHMFSIFVSTSWLRASGSAFLSLYRCMLARREFGSTPSTSPSGFACAVQLTFPSFPSGLPELRSAPCRTASMTRSPVRECGNHKREPLGLNQFAFSDLQLETSPENAGPKPKTEAKRIVGMLVPSLVTLRSTCSCLM
ncbi:hypothetical protein H4582DRAFT_986976 [Lactarius indigo]|nr:hypothetical protein H4582DRAFT_986976 [Lactarius indigo]